MRGIKVLLAVLFVFLSCNAVFANVADIKSETNASQSLNLVPGQDSSNFVLAAVVAGNGDLVNYRRGHGETEGVATAAVPAPAEAESRGRRHGKHANDD